MSISTCSSLIGCNVGCVMLGGWCPGYTPSLPGRPKIGSLVDIETLSKGTKPVTILDTMCVKNGGRIWNE